MSGGLDAYYFGANLMAHILPENEKQPLIRVNVLPPDGGKMTIDKLSEVLQVIQECSDIVGLTIAEYLPFDEYQLHKMFKKLNILID